MQGESTSDIILNKELCFSACIKFSLVPRPSRYPQLPGRVDIMLCYCTSTPATTNILWSTAELSACKSLHLLFVLGVYS